MKKVLSLLLIVMLVLTGCGTQSSTSKEASTSQSETSSAAWVPTENIELVIPFSAGGGSDVFARKIVEIIEKNNLCPVTIVPTNKPGGSGVVGYTYMNKKGADNYIMATTSSSFYSQPLSGNSPLNCYDSFSFISHLCKDPNLFAASKKTGFTSLQDMIDYAKAHKGELKYGGTGNVSDDAILMYMINELCGIEMVYVPYDSGAEVLAAILGGHIDLCAISPSEAGEHLTAGNIIPLAVSSDNRLSVIPDIPTFAELGVDINHQQSRGVVMNAGVPEEVIAYYSDMLKKVSETDEWKKFVEENVMTNSYMNHSTYVEFNKELADDYKKFMEIISKNS